MGNSPLGARILPLPRPKKPAGTGDRFDEQQRAQRPTGSTSTPLWRCQAFLCGQWNDWKNKECRTCRALKAAS